MSKHANKRTEEQKILDYIFIGECLIKEWRQHQIVDELARLRPYRLSQQQISLDIAKLRKEWQARAATMIDSQKAKDLAGLEHQERELWVAWERSKQDAVKTATTKIVLKSGKKKVRLPANEVTTTVEHQCGDPAYMKLILDIRDRRAKLLGLDAPAKQEVTGSVKMESAEDFSKLSVDELREYVRLQTKLEAQDGNPPSGGAQPT